MRSSSEAIGQLASALAKAQIELVNPLKTLTGVIHRWGIGKEGQVYRYAPLSAGLEIVRKTLCKHELAVIQTTHLESESGLLMLATRLAHGSGEWICSSWPVCKAAEMSDPKVMGSALTYARRYGLFTIVGLAGEDDLDAPQLSLEAQTQVGSQFRKPSDPRSADICSQQSEVVSGSDWPKDTPLPRALSSRGRGSVAKQGPRRKSETGLPSEPDTPALPADHLLRQLRGISDPEELFAWALATLPHRSSLSEAKRASFDAAFVERRRILVWTLRFWLPLTR
jgi:hypothetical protein